MNKVAVGLTLGLTVLFFIATLVIPPDPMVVGFSAGVFVALAVGLGKWAPAVLFVFFPALQRPDGEKAERETGYGLVGLVLWMISEEGKRIYSVTNVQLGHPDWLPDLYVNAFLTAMAFAGIVLLVLAARFEGEKPTKLPTIVMGLIAFLGVLMSYALPTLIAKLILFGTVVLKIGIVSVH